MAKLFFFSITVIVLFSGFKSNSNYYQIEYFDSVPVKSIDTSIRRAKPDTLKDAHIIFTKAEVPPSIDQSTWRKHIQGYLISTIENATKQNVPAGTYTVQIKFMVETDGSIKDVQALNDAGYGFTQAAIKVVETSPKWVPAMQNGTVVRSIYTQPITFVIQEK